MSDVSGIPYMGPMGVGNLFAPLYPALSGGGNMSAGQISAPYAGPSAYAQNVVNNLFSSGGGFGAQTDYYSQLAANQLSALTPNTFNMSNAGTGLTASQLQQPWLTPEGGVNNVFSGGGSFQGPPPAPSFAPAYNYGSLYGSGGAAAPPSAYGYGSLGGGGGIGGLGGGRTDPFPGMSMPGGLNQPMALPSMGYDYGSLYGGGGGSSISDRLIRTLVGGGDSGGGAAAGGGLFQGGFPNAGGYQTPSSQRLLGYDPNAGPQSAQAPPMGYDYGSLGGRGGIYDPFNVGGRLDPALYGPGGLGGGGGIGQAPAAMPDLQRLLGYNPRQLSALPDRSGIDFRTPDVQGGIDSLQQTLDLIDRTTGGGYTLSPQDRDIPFSGGGGFRDSSFFAPGGIGGDSGSPYADSGLPLEITQGGSTPGGALFSDFNRSLFGNAPAYPSGVVGGPYELPNLTSPQAQDPFGGGGPFPYTREDLFADSGLPPEITRGASGGGGGGGGDNRFMLPDVTNQDRTFTLFDSPDIRDRIAFGGGIGPASRLYSDADLAPGLRTQQLLKAPYNSTNFNELNQAYLLDQQRARFGQQLQTNPAMLKTVLALAPAEMGKGNTDEAYQAFFESFLNRGAAYSTDLNPSAPKNVTGRAPGLVDLMSDPEILGGSYYEPINKGKMQPHLDSLNDPNDPENFDRLNNILNRVLAGSNVGNLPLGNSSYGGKANPSMGPGSILPRYGGDYGMYFPVPGSAGEYLTSKLNPYNNPKAQDFIGAGNQAGNRAWWMNLMPIGSAPWATGGR